MKEKMKITEDNYKEIVLKRSIIICWILLAICFVIKLFGGNFFAIVCTNENFIKFCDFIDKYYISIAFQFIFFSFSSYFIIKCVNFKICKSRVILISIFLFLYWCFKILIFLNIISINVFLYDVLDFIVLYFACIMSYDRKTQFTLKGLLKPILFIFLLFIFSLISALVKNIGYKDTLNDSFLMAFIFMIDYYIMIILNYLYQKRRFLKWEATVGFIGSAKK